MALAAATAIMPNGGNIPFAIVPEDYVVASLEPFIFNSHTEYPERIKQTVTVLDPASFVEYYQQFSDTESRVFAYEPERKVTAILDYHESSTGDTSDGTATPRW